MFKNILIVEDHESTNISVRKTLDDLGAPCFEPVYYCDDALNRIQRKLIEKAPYELMITDLYFEEDEHVQSLKNGIELITAAKKVQPGLKVLVFSAEHKAAVIDLLFNDLEINGYVRKARNDAQELKAAIEKIYQNRQHFPVHLRQAVKQKNAHDFSDFDITLISLLAQGLRQKDIPAYLQKNQIKPSGLSSVEKRLNLMKEALQFLKNEQLVAFCKDIGII